MSQDFNKILIQSLVIAGGMLVLFVALMTSPARAWGERATVALSSPVPTASIEHATGEVVNASEIKPISIEEKIAAASALAGVSPRVALRIAKCESSLNPAAKNQKSTASGLYQFTIGTWRWIGAEAAGLDRMNPDHAIAMFMAWYPRYPGWWECK